MKLTGYNYACNSLTNLKFKAHAMTGNKSYVNILKFPRIVCETTSAEFIFGKFYLFGATVCHAEGGQNEIASHVW